MSWPIATLVFDPINELRLLDEAATLRIAGCAGPHFFFLRRARLGSLLYALPLLLRFFAAALLILPRLTSTPKAKRCCFFDLHLGMLMSSHNHP